jgi:acyl carrier protein
LLVADNFRMLQPLMSQVATIDSEIRAFLTRKAPHQRQTIEQLGPTDPIWGNVDSLLILALVTHLEKTFNIKFTPKDFTPENLATLERLVSFVDKAMLAAKPAQA